MAYIGWWARGSVYPAGVAAHHAGQLALHPAAANLVTVLQRNVCGCEGGLQVCRQRQRTGHDSRSGSR